MCLYNDIAKILFCDSVDCDGHKRLNKSKNKYATLKYPG